MTLPIATLGLPVVVHAATPSANLEVAVAGLRSDHGLLRACLTGNPAFFPACDKDPAARHLSIAASGSPTLHFDGLAPGGYALAVFHDENGDGRLDTRMGVPIEGFGFSNNPRIWFGAPRFAAARIVLAPGDTTQTVRIRYLF